MKKCYLSLVILCVAFTQSVYAVDAWSEKFQIRIVETSLNNKQVTVFPVGGSVAVSGSACTPRTYFRFTEPSTGIEGYDSMVTQLLIAAASKKEIRLHGECHPTTAQHTSRVIQVFYQ